MSTDTFLVYTCHTCTCRSCVNFERLKNVEEYLTVYDNISGLTIFRQSCYNCTILFENFTV